MLRSAMQAMRGDAVAVKSKSSALWKHQMGSLVSAAVGQTQAGASRQSPN